jgi:hypothetical protein
VALQAIASRDPAEAANDGRLILPSMSSDSGVLGNRPRAGGGKGTDADDFQVCSGPWCTSSDVKWSQGISVAQTGQRFGALVRISALSS